MIKLFVTGVLIIILSFFLSITGTLPQYSFAPFLIGTIGFVLMLAGAITKVPKKSVRRRK